MTQKHGGFEIGTMIWICQSLGMEKWCINQGRMDALSSSLSRSRVRASTVANITLMDETRERNMAVLAGTSGVWAKAGAASARAVGSERAATAAVFFSFNLDIRGITSVSSKGAGTAATSCESVGALAGSTGLGAEAEG